MCLILVGTPQFYPAMNAMKVASEAPSKTILITSMARVIWSITVKATLNEPFRVRVYKREKRRAVR